MIIPVSVTCLPVAATHHEVIGCALAGPSGIKRVQVSTDDRVTWHEAQFVENNSPYVRTVWKYHFAPRNAWRMESACDPGRFGKTGLWLHSGDHSSVRELGGGCSGGSAGTRVQ